MNRTNILIGTISVLLLSSLVWLVQADRPNVLDLTEPTIGNSHLRFIQNQGQWDDRIHYKVPLSGGAIYAEENRLTYHFIKEPTVWGHGKKVAQAFGMRGDKVQHHVFQMEFKGANPQPRLVSQLKYPEYHNYFIGNDPEKWAGGVSLFGMLTYEDLYPGIDLRVYGLGEQIKYDFIVAPGADPSQIQVSFDGLDELTLKKGHLHLKTSLRDITELPPVSYQEVDGEKMEVKSRFRLEEGIVSYELPKGYDNRYSLIIDPTLVFSTYTGSVANNWGMTATFDLEGNAYAGGIQRGNDAGSGYPTTLGAFQTSFAGGTSDVAISKFSADGSTLIYSTYLGGPPGGNPFTDYQDQPHSMVVTDSGELVVFGRTNSPNFPVTVNAYQTGLGGGYDIFVTKFTPDGTGLIGSTYIGGSSGDGVNGGADFSIFTDTKYNYGDDARGEVILKSNGNILVAGSTKSDNFPTTGAAAQGSFGGGQDGCVFELNPTLTNLNWSTYYGSNGDDAAYTVKIDQAGSIFIAGGTTSSNLPGSNGLNGSFLGGEADGFVAKLNANGSAIQQATYLGTNDYDQVYLLDIDRLNDIYVVGQSEGDYPITNAPLGPVYFNQGSKQFIVKLNNALTSTIYATVFGSDNASKPNISPTALLVDRCDNVYVAGWGGSTNQFGNTNNMPIFDPLSGGNNTDGSDFYTIVLSRDAQDLIFGSYFGGNNVSGQAGDHVDGGTSRFDKNGIVYHAVCAGCWGVSTFPSTPGAYSETNNATGPGSADPGCNLLVFKLAFDLAGVEADFTPIGEDSEPIILEAGCAPYEVTFDNESFEGANPGDVTYLWDFGDNGATSTDEEPVHIYSAPGTYDVMLIITDSSSCNISDTAYRQVLIFPPPPVEIGPDFTACLDDTITLTSQSVGVEYIWGPEALIIGPNDVPAPQVFIGGETVFTLELTDANGCTGFDSITISIDTTFRVNARADTVICEGGSVPLSVFTSEPAISYEWSSIPAVPISDPTIANPTVSGLDTTTMFYIVAEDQLGCKNLDSVRVEVFEVFTLEDTFVCLGSSIVLASSNGVSFTWEPDDGSLNNPNIASPTATPSVTTTYTVTAVSGDGCISVKDVTVEVKPLPEADVSKDEVICVGDTVPLTASGGLTYSWSPATGLDDPTSPTPIATPVASTNYTVTVFDEFGCSDQAELVITVNPLPPVVASPDATICEGESIPLNVSGARTYEWTPATGLDNPGSSDPIASPVSPTTYVVTGMDENGCQASDSVEIGVVPRPITEIQGVNRTCEGGQIELTASGGDTYVWNTGQTTPMISVLPTTPTLYIATAFVGGCEGLPDSVLVDQFFAFPEADFTFDPVTGFSPITVNFTNLSTQADAYLWDFGFGLNSEEENPSHVYPAAGEYEIRLIATTDQNCADTVVKTIRLDNVTLHAPTAFTPNQDGINDEFFVGYVGIETLNVQIFSRWGIKVYESDNPDFRWDGTYQAREVPEGVYVYKIEGTGENSLRYSRNGTVTIFR